jgi:membrane-bound lytic murein transglycosylase D
MGNRKLMIAFIPAMLLLFAMVSAQPERAIQFQKYIVKEGETPGIIAEKFNVKKKDFLMLNNFPSNVVLKPGEEVLIRQLIQGETPIEEGAYGGSYSARNGSTVSPARAEEKKEEPAPKAPVRPNTPNAVTAAKEKPAEAVVEKPAPPPAPPKSTQTGPGGTKYVVSDNSYHIVEKGQTFYRIALIYGLTVDQLKALNNMTNTTISVGQKLKVK